MAYSQIHFSL